MRIVYFLSASFVSSFGDMLLVFALPAGLGIATNDIRSTVLLWMIPAVAMYASSCCHNFISSRIGKARKDYAFLLIIISAIEAITSIIAIRTNNPLILIVSCSVFVFFYAFIKEGVTRVFYNVQVYRFFTTDENYAKLAGWHNAFEILAMTLGGIAAGFLVFSGTWKLALAIDALTFFLLGCILLIAGRDARPRSVSTSTQSKIIFSVKEYYFLLKSINITMPLLFGLNALGWNYITLILDDLSIVNTSDAIYASTILQVPGMIVGANFGRLQSILPIFHFILTIPILFFLSVVIFFSFPAIEIFYFSAFLVGMVYGLLWPAERYVKSLMDDKTMINYNQMILKRLSIFQLLSCILSLFIFSLNKFNHAVVASSLVIFFLIIATRNIGFNVEKFKQS